MNRTADASWNPLRRAKAAMFRRPGLALRLWDAALDRLPRLLALLIAVQVTAIFKDYWWQETYAIVYAGIWAAAVTELLIGRLSVLRFCPSGFDRRVGDGGVHPVCVVRLAGHLEPLG